MVKGQGGLLDVKVFDHRKKEVFITYAKKQGSFFETALSRARLKDHKRLVYREIFVSKTRSRTGYHFGSRVVFDDQKQFLYMSIGDRGERDKAQDLSSHNGKIIRDVRNHTNICLLAVFCLPYCLHHPTISILQKHSIMSGISDHY